MMFQCDNEINLSKIFQFTYHEIIVISICQETCTDYKFHILIIMSAECEH